MARTIIFGLKTESLVQELMLILTLTPIGPCRCLSLNIKSRWSGLRMARPIPKKLRPAVDLGVKR